MDQPVQEALPDGQEHFTWSDYLINKMKDSGRKLEETYTYDEVAITEKCPVGRLAWNKYVHLKAPIIWAQTDIQELSSHKGYDIAEFRQAAFDGCMTCTFFCDVISRCTGHAVTDLRGKVIGFSPVNNTNGHPNLRFQEDDQRWRALGISCDSCGGYDHREDHYHCEECAGTSSGEIGQFDLCADCFESGISCPENHTLTHRSINDGETNFELQGSFINIEFIRVGPEPFCIEFRDYRGPGTVDVPRTCLVPGNTGSETSLSTAAGWIEECVNGHSSCADGTPSQLPTRVLDIGYSQEQDFIRLYDQTAGQNERYACLSHCWGGVQLITTTKETTEERRRGINLELLPKTFKDAVIVARQLKIRYLWIDSLCIIQDDEEDWKSQASTMASIYRNAYLTIAATAAANSTAGLFITAPATHQHHRYEYTTASGKSCEIYARRPLPHNWDWKLQDSNPDDPFPLMSRAWAYQERLLSPRVLHFSSSELWWECGECNNCECATREPRVDRNPPPKVAHNRALLAMAPVKLKERWHDLVSSYSCLALTYEKDRLYALDGLKSQFREASIKAQNLQDQLSDPWLYQSGIFLGGENSCDGLCWYRDPFWVRIVNLAVPTWSWASSNNVEFCHDRRFDPESFDLEEVCYTEYVRNSLSINDGAGTPLAQDPYIRLLGPVAEAKLYYRSKNNDEPILESTRHGAYSVPSPHTYYKKFEGSHKVKVTFTHTSPNITADIYEDYPIPYAVGEEHMAVGSTVYCLLVYQQTISSKYTSIYDPPDRMQRYERYTSLVLAPCSNSDTANKYYKRIGLLYTVMSCGTGEQIWPNNKEKQLVTIV